MKTNIAVETVCAESEGATEGQLKELSELQLALVGGGIGDAILG